MMTLWITNVIFGQLIRSSECELTWALVKNIRHLSHENALLSVQKAARDSFNEAIGQPNACVFWALAGADTINMKAQMSTALDESIKYLEECITAAQAMKSNLEENGGPIDQFCEKNVRFLRCFRLGVGSY